MLQTRAAFPPFSLAQPLLPHHKGPELRKWVDWHQQSTAHEFGFIRLEGRTNTATQTPQPVTLSIHV